MKYVILAFCKTDVKFGNYIIIYCKTRLLYEKFTYVIC